MNEKTKRKEEIYEVFITLSIGKTDFKTDKDNNLSMFKTFEKNLKKPKISAYCVVMEHGEHMDHPHLHIYMRFKSPQSHTQISRIVMQPAKKLIMSINPALWSYNSCKSKKAGNSSLLLHNYFKKEQQYIMLTNNGIDWKKVCKKAETWLQDNLHKKPLNLKHISINTLPYYIHEYAKLNNLMITDRKEFILVIEHMIHNNYNLFSLYRNSSLIRQTYNYVMIIRKNTINYLTDYNIHTHEYISPDMKLFEMKQILDKINKRMLQENF